MSSEQRHGHQGAIDFYSKLPGEPGAVSATDCVQIFVTGKVDAAKALFDLERGFKAIVNYLEDIIIREERAG